MTKAVLGTSVWVLSILIVGQLQGQAPGGSLSGTVTGPSAAVVPNARISLKNVATEETVEAETDAAGTYNIQNIKPGDYDIAISAEGFNPRVAKVTVTAEAKQTLDFALTPALSLEGLGFPQSKTQGSAQEQARLDKRTRMLKIHQRLGLITTAPLLATVITGSFAGGRSTSSTTRDLHAVLGSTTAGLYFTTAYFAIRAPKISGTQARGPIRLHKALAWIHGPGMVLTPILGAMAFQQKSNGQKVHGIASAHGPVAYVTAGAFGAAIVAVSLKF